MLTGRERGLEKIDEQSVQSVFEFGDFVCWEGIAPSFRSPLMISHSHLTNINPRNSIDVARRSMQNICNRTDTRRHANSDTDRQRDMLGHTFAHAQNRSRLQNRQTHKEIYGYTHTRTHARTHTRSHARKHARAYAPANKPGCYHVQLFTGNYLSREF